MIILGERIKCINAKELSDVISSQELQFIQSEAVRWGFKVFNMILDTL